jgi:hypothetical protein
MDHVLDLDHERHGRDLLRWVRRCSMIRFPILAVAVVAALVGLPSSAAAHCDTLDGPVVAAARLALERGDVQPVLKWVKADAEPELRAAFQKTLAVRRAGGESLELADRYFFETLVRLHRAGEGAPYTGLKPAGSTEKPVEAADRAIEQGSVDGLSGMLTTHLASALAQRFARVAESKAAADRTPEDGRRYVAAYVDYVHFVEAVVQAVHGHAAHARAGAEPH